ncbi:MAG: BPSS1780 family membrane protein [Chromatiales bacterium]
MSENYRITYTGKVDPDRDLEQVIDRFSEKFKLDRQTAEKLIRAGKPVSLKKDLTLDKAEKYLKALQRIGIDVEIDPKPPELEPVAAPSETTLELMNSGSGDTAEVSAPSPAIDRCPKCGSTNMRMGICQDCGIVAEKYLAAQSVPPEVEGSAAATPSDQANPYSAPEADLVEAMENEISGPSGVPVGNCISWIGKGWWHFKSSALAWIGALILWFIISFVLGFIPVLGFIASLLGGPVIMAGFMYGCSEQDAGGDFSISHLFSGFTNNLGQLLLVAVFYLIMLILAMVILIGGIFILAGGAAALDNPEIMVTMGGGAITGMAVLGLLLIIPIMMSYIFAPALVMLDNLSAFEAMKYSFMGCLKNILPLFVFSLLGTVLLFIGMLPIGLGLLVVFPILTAALYTAYRDIYFG